MNKSSIALSLQLQLFNARVYVSDLISIAVVCMCYGLLCPHMYKCGS
jgi:hypothetical protein